MAQVTVKQTGGDYGSLDAAMDSAEADISIEGTWTSAETNNCTPSVSTTVVTDADSKVPADISGTQTWYRLKPTTGIAISTTASLTVTGLHVENQSTTTSDECYRLDAQFITLTKTNCQTGFASSNSQQDCTYINNKSGCSVNETNCIGYNAGRSYIGCFRSGSSGQFHSDINSCHVYDIGGQNEAAAGLVGVVGGGSTALTGTIDVFNTAAHCSGAQNASNDVIGLSSLINIMSITVDHVITNRSDIDNVTETNSLLSHNWTDDDTKASDGDWVIVADVTSSIPDLTLVTNTYNEAEEWTSSTTGAGLTMPSTDLAGTTRTSLYCCGAIEIGEGGAPPDDVFFQNQLHPIHDGIGPQTAAAMSGVLVT